MKKILLACAILLVFGLAAGSCNDKGGEPAPNPFPGPGPYNTSYVEINGTKYTLPLGKYNLTTNYEEDEAGYTIMVGYYDEEVNPMFEIEFGKNLAGKIVTMAEGGDIWSFSFYAHMGGIGFDGSNADLGGIAKGIMRVTPLGNNRFRAEADVTSAEGDRIKIYFEGRLRSATPAVVGSAELNGSVTNIWNDGLLAVFDMGDYYSVTVSSSREGEMSFNFDFEKELLGKAIVLEEGGDMWSLALQYDNRSLNASSLDASSTLISGVMRVSALGEDVYKIECNLTSAEGDDVDVQVESTMEVFATDVLGTFEFDGESYSIPQNFSYFCYEYDDYYTFYIGFDHLNGTLGFNLSLGKELLGQAVALEEGDDYWAVTAGLYIAGEPLSIDADNGDPGYIDSGSMRITSLGNNVFRIECAMDIAGGHQGTLEFEGEMNYQDNRN